MYSIIYASEKMAKSVIWSEEALRDLEYIAEYISRG